MDLARPNCVLSLATQQGTDHVHEVHNQSEGPKGSVVSDSQRISVRTNIFTITILFKLHSIRAHCRLPSFLLFQVCARVGEAVAVGPLFHDDGVVYLLNKLFEFKTVEQRFNVVQDLI